MALGTNHLSNTATTSVGDFIPEIWSDDVIAAYKAMLVMGNLVRKISHVGKRGDTIHIPNPARGSANDKAVGSQVTLNEVATADIPITINKWKEYSTVIEDIISVQALPSLRRFTTDDAGYAVGTAVDQALAILSASWQSGTVSAAALYETGVIGGDGSTAFAGASGGNGTALTDVGLRTAIQTLDDSDVPSNDRFLVIPPTVKKTLTGLGRFTEQAFVGNGSVIRNGMLGEVYGVSIAVTTNSPWIHTNSVTNTQSGTFSSTQPTGATYTDAYGNTVDWNTSSPTDVKYRVCQLFQRDANVLVEQQSVRSQAQYIQQYLGWLYTTDMIFGTANVRTANGISIVVPA